MAFAHVGLIRVSSDRNTANWATWSATTTANDVEANNLIIAVLATDNVDAANGNSTTHGAITVGSQALTKAREFTNAQGAAAAGATVSVWYGKNETGSTIATGAATTVNLNGAAPGSGAKALTLHEFTMDSSKTVQVDANATDLENDGADAGSQAISGLSSAERLYVRGMAGEGSTATATTPSANFTAFTGTQTAAGGAATNIGVRGEFRINTSTGETSDPTSGMGAVDHASVFVALSEVAVGASLLWQPAPSSLYLR